MEGQKNLFSPAHLEPFECKITVQSQAHADLMTASGKKLNTIWIYVVLL